jgi:CheY-like chemotaxis protein
MLKVLIVDDDKRMVKTIEDILTIKGFEITTAFSGEEAVEKVRTSSPDCVLMDNLMGGISGAQAYSMIKDISPELPVIFMTADITDEVKKACSHDGAYAVLSKPINIVMLLSFLTYLKKTLSIIIIDNNKEFCNTLKDVLILRDYNAQCLLTPEDLPKLLAGGQSNTIILLDIKLGDLNGIDVLKDIKKTYPLIPIVLVTAYHSELQSEIEEGLLLNAYTCLYKPLEIETLSDTLMEINRKKLKEILGVPFKKSG